MAGIMACVSGELRRVLRDAGVVAPQAGMATTTLAAKDFGSPCWRSFEEHWPLPKSLPLGQEGGAPGRCSAAEFMLVPKSLAPVRRERARSCRSFEELPLCRRAGRWCGVDEPSVDATLRTSCMAEEPVVGAVWMSSASGVEELSAGAALRTSCFAEEPAGAAGRSPQLAQLRGAPAFDEPAAGAAWMSSQLVQLRGSPAWP